MKDIAVDQMRQFISNLTTAIGRGVFMPAIVVANGIAFHGSAAASTIAVSDGGVAGYSVSIDIPPGVAGVEPKLSLQYSASGTDGPLGHGWSISGISAIGRCAANRATDGVFGAVTFGESDKLCLNGERLISTDSSGVPLAATTLDASGVSTGYREYRLEKDSFTRVRAYGIANGASANGPAYFRVWTKDGLQLEFGNTENSRIEAQGKTVVAIWAVNKQSDAASNSIEYTYEEREIASGSGPTAEGLSGKEWNIARIIYTTHLGTQGKNRLDFIYTDRVDGRGEAYRNGSKTVNVRLLQEIKTYTNQQSTDPLFYESGTLSTSSIPVKTYKLEYDISPASGTKRPLLHYIRECSGQNAARCFPPHEFKYASGSGEIYVEDSGFNLKNETLYTKNGDYSIITGDFDGDGRTDIIRTGNFGSANNDPVKNVDLQNILFLSRSTVVGSPDIEKPSISAEFKKSNNFNLAATRIYGCSSLQQDVSLGEVLGQGAYVADFNGDGYDDILSISAGPDGGHRYCPAAGVRLYLSRGDGSFDERLLPGMFLADYYQFVYALGDSGTTGFVKGEAISIGDYDGDGLPDILKSKAYERGQPGVGDIVYENILFKNLGGGNFDTGSTPPVFGDQSWGSTLAGQPLYLADYAYGDAYASRLPKGKSRTNFIDVTGDGRADIVRAPGGPVTAASVNNFGSVGDAAAAAPVSHAAPSLLATQVDGGWYAIDAMPTDCHRVAWVDVNGDQLPDLLCLGYTGFVPDASGDSTHYVSHNFPPSLYINTGAGQFKAANFNLANLNDSSGRYFVSDSSAVLADVNADGMTDVISITTSQNETRVWLSNGDGSFREAANNLTAWKFRQVTPEVSYVAGMFTGRGQMEYIRLGDSSSGFNNQLIRKEASLLSDLMISAKAPSGNNSSVRYRFLSDGLMPTIYESARGTTHASTYPMLDMQPQATVVSSVTRDSGIGLDNVAHPVTEHFKYGGLKAEIGRRGVVGFREILRDFQGPNGEWLTSYKEFNQSFPIVGAAKTVGTYLGKIESMASSPLTSTDYLYCDTAYQIDSECPETAQGSTLRLLRRPYVRRTIDSGVDLSSATLNLPTVTTTNTYDKTYGDWGDVAQVAVTTAGLLDGAVQTYSTVTTNTYKAPVISGDSWLLGRLQHSAVQNTVPDVVLVASSGSAANASAIDGGTALNRAPSVAVEVVSNTGVAPATITLSASAQDSDGVISRVDFYRDGQLIGTDGSAPYTFTWSNAPVGHFVITAVAIDNAGAATTSAAVAADVINAPPTVSVTSPGMGAQFTAPGSIPLTVAVNDINGSVTQVQYYANGTLIGSSSTAPFSFNWVNAPAGSYAIYARATDNDGGSANSSTIQITVNPPITVTVSPDAIAASQCSSGVLSANATVSVVGGTSPYTYSWQQMSSSGAAISVTGLQVATFKSSIYVTGDNPVTSGTAVYRVVVGDADGKSSTKDLNVNFTVGNCQAITVATPIVNNSGTVPATIVLNASVVSQALATKVEFYRDSGILIGADTSYPFSFTWENVPSGTYQVYAKAYDDIPSVGTSTSIGVTVANVSPSISITSPANGAVYVAPQTIPIAVSASDVGGSVVKVLYYANGTLVGSSLSAPFGFDWKNATPGSYTIAAVAEDNNGAQTTSLARSVVVQNSPPTISLNTPLNGASFTAPATINLTPAVADANDSVAKVEYFSNGNLVGTVSASPFAFVMSNVPVGTYAIYARATDTFGAAVNSAIATVQVSTAPNQVPASSLNLTSNSGTAPASVSLSYTASDPDGTITKVELLDAGSIVTTAYQGSGTFQLSGVAAGLHTYTAKATDNAGASTVSSPVSVTVANALPVVSIVTPSSGAKFTAPATIPLSVSTSDANGYVAKVEYFSNGQLIATSTTSPFSYSWAGVPAGTYSLKSRATDNVGATTESAPAAITVNPPIALALTPTSINVSQCALNFSATSTIGVTGGTAPYTFGWQRISTTGAPITVSGAQTGTFKASIYPVGDNPTLTGTSVFRASVTDAAGVTATKDISVKFTLLTNSCGGGGGY